MRPPDLTGLFLKARGWVEIDVARQCLTLHYPHGVSVECAVSTGINGVGQEQGSGKTPLGWHYVRAAIGEGMPVGSVFRGRRPTGEIYSPRLASAFPERDWILTRILWLCGLEPGINRGGAVDTQRRYIYLHGTPPEEPMGRPASHGCIRLAADDLLTVFAASPPGTPVLIHA